MPASTTRDRIRPESPWWRTLLFGACLVALVRCLYNGDPSEPLLVQLLWNTLYGTVLFLLAAFPLWILSRRVGPAWALVLALALTAGTVEGLGILFSSPSSTGSASVSPSRLDGRQLARVARRTIEAGLLGLAAAGLTLMWDQRRSGPTQAASPCEVPAAFTPVGRATSPTGRQRRIVGVAVGALVGMLLLPPWVFTLHVRVQGQRIDAEKPAGYAPIFAPPAPDSDAGGVRLDVTRLLVQMAIVGLIAGALSWHTAAGHAGRARPASVPPRGPLSPHGPAASRPGTSPSMARLFSPDGQLVPEARPFDEGSLLSVESDTLLPVWWSDTDEEGIPWSPRQRIRAFEDVVRAHIAAGPRNVDDGSEVKRILAALRYLRSVTR
jgi:hypothetical protein